MKELKNGYASGSSSPPTPPSPLPISVGPGSHKYLFSPSPPFSLPPSAYASAENLPLLQDNPPLTPAQVTSTFSVDRKHLNELEDKSSCPQDLLEWLAQKCCSRCSGSLLCYLSQDFDTEI